MKGDSEKIVSIGGWGTANMMRYCCHCYSNLPIATLQSAPTPNAKPNSESPFMSSPFDTFLDVKQNDRSFLKNEMLVANNLVFRIIAVVDSVSRTQNVTNKIRRQVQQVKFGKVQYAGS
jgi:hypothetical protein